MNKLLAAIACTAALAGCAGLPQTADQIITVDVSPKVPSTHCVLSNEVTSVMVYNAPSHISVLRGREPLVVNCSSPMGWRGNATVAAAPSLGTPLFGAESTDVQIGSNTALPDHPYQGGTTNAWNGTFNRYPGTIVVRMVRADR